MKIAIPFDWIDDFIAHPDNDYDLICQNIKWKFISKDIFAYRQFGKDYYFCNCEMVKE